MRKARPLGPLDDDITRHRVVISAMMGMERSRVSSVPARGACALFEDDDASLHFYVAGDIEYRDRLVPAEMLAILEGIGQRTARGRTIVLKAVCIASEGKVSPCLECMVLVEEFGAKDCQVIHYNPATRKDRLLARISEE